MKKLLKWQEKFLVEIEKMSNDELLDSTIWGAGGDDYDGCFTDRGQWEFDKLRIELDKRLKAIGFLEK